MDRDLAIAQLEALTKIPGGLKVITNEVRPDLRADATDPNSPLREAVVDGVDLARRPDSYVLHDVTRIELAGGAPGEGGQYVAYTAEGDYCQGQPEALLVRLQEWRTGS